MSGARKGTDRIRRKRDAIFYDGMAELHEFYSLHNLPPFGSQLGILKAKHAADVIVCHRILNKYEPIIPGREASRKASSISAMLEADVPKPITWSDDLRMAKARLSYWFRGFKPSYRFRAPSGASALANQGENDILIKLSDTENWEVSPECLPYAVSIAYSNQSLKRLVKREFRKAYPYLHMNDLFREKHGVKPYAIFGEMFKSLVTLRGVSRLTTVPKDNQEDRVITCEPLWDMVCQLSFMADIRDHMRKRIGLPLNMVGEWHKTIIRNADVCTIDLKKASDSVQLSLVRGLWPDSMLKWLEKLRPHTLETDDGEYHHLNMFAPMGTGVTFDVMTYTILALLRFDRSASVFGDDIITKQPERALCALRDAGLVVNATKSFFGGKFRESCGGMYHDDIGYITSYDFRYPTDVTGWVTIVNKLGLILAAKQVTPGLRAILYRLYEELQATFPRVAFADMPLQLESRFITGLGGSGRSSAVGQVAGGLLHRDIPLLRGYQVTSLRTNRKVNQDTAEALFLYRGSTMAVRDKTEVRLKTYDGWSGTPLMEVGLYSVVRV